MSESLSLDGLFTTRVSVRGRKKDVIGVGGGANGGAHPPGPVRSSGESFTTNQFSTDVAGVGFVDRTPRPMGRKSVEAVVPATNASPAASTAMLVPMSRAAPP